MIKRNYYQCSDAGSSHPSEADDDCKPFKKRKKLNPPSQTLTPSTAVTSASTPLVPVPIESQPKAHAQNHPEQQQKSHPQPPQPQTQTQPPQPQPQPEQPPETPTHTQQPQPQQPHKYLAPTSAVNNLPHVLPPPPPLEVQHRPLNEEIRMNKNLPKSTTKGKSQKPKRRHWTPAEDEAVCLYSSENIEA